MNPLVDTSLTRLEIDGRLRAPSPDGPLRLATETASEGGAAVTRFRLRYTGKGRLSRSTGRDALTYFGFRVGGTVTEVRLSEFDPQTHMFLPGEREVAADRFAAGLACFGPILAWEADGVAHLVAYEHGSQVPDAFLEFRLQPDYVVHLAAVKGNYSTGHDLAVQPLVSPWFHAAEVKGTLDDLADTYRTFLLRHQAPAAAASRRPRVFYNTWNAQEREKHWHGRPYLAPMNEPRMLAEIDAAADLGVETFVIDTGWYDKTGDWRVSRERFPRGLDPIRQRLDRHGMELGLWFNPVIAGQTSAMFTDHRHLAMTFGGKRPDPEPVWETEPAYGMCLCSDYADLFVDQLIRLHRETGVTYFKWDAIGQYGCDSPDHDHGTTEDTPGQRRAAYAFQLPGRMAYVVQQLQAVCPDATVDFDVTEGGRAFGLGFLAAGKYFLINNGPYFFNYDVNVPPDRSGQGRNSNVFFQPGLARDRLCRHAYAFDRWVPSVLTLTHYLPDDTDLNRHREHAWQGRDYDAQQVQRDVAASLMLGHGGLWGDLTAVSPAGRRRLRGYLDAWKQVRDDATAASPVRSGPVGGSPEIHEKINPATGRGVVCLFSPTPGHYTYLTHHRVAETHTAAGRIRVSPAHDGKALLTWSCHQPGAAFVCFDASEA
jgi:alpha-galactosidase